MFKTANQYADHLSTLIDDEDIVLAAVRRKFPKYGKHSPRIADRPKRESRQDEYLSRFDGAYTSELTQLSFHRNMEEGSHRLLSALWTNHAPILMRLSENENCTVMRA